MKSPIPSWSDAKFKGWIVSLLRRGTMRYPPRNDALRAAKVGKRLNPKTGRMSEHYICSGCAGEFPGKEISMDHIDPIVDPNVGFIDWNTYMERMWVPVEKWQPLCKDCHDAKSKEERTQRKIK